MGVYKLSTAGGLKTPRTNYSSFLAGNPAVTFSSYESIATTTVGAGGSTTVTFSSIPGTYTHLQMRIIAQASTTTEQFNPMYFDINSDTTSTNYYRHHLQGNGSTVVASAQQLSFIAQIQDKNNSASTFSGVIIDVLDYANTNKYKTMRCLYGGDVNGAGGIVGLASSLWKNTNAISSITLSLSGGSSPKFTEYSSFALYGIKVP